MRFYQSITSKPFDSSQQEPARRKAVALLLAGVITLLLLGSFWFTVQAARASDPAEIEITGTVMTAPALPDGHGTWQVMTENQRLYTVITTVATDFKNGIPRPNQVIKLKGTLNAPQQINAKELEILSEKGEDGVRLKGRLLRTPDNATGTGLWILQTGTTLTYTLVVNNATRLDNGVPAPGAWLEARGQWQPDGSLLATRVRVDDHAVNQVIVRLAAGVLSATIASEYGLLPLKTLVASGNIHLFQTAEDQEFGIVNQLKANTSQVIWAELNFAGGIPEGHGYKTWHWGGTDASGYINQEAFAQINLPTDLPGQNNAQGDGVIIAVLDTGVDLSHPALKNRLLSGWDMVSDDNLPNDEGDGLGWGHGTHVTGILAKVAPQSQLLPVRVLDSNGRGNTFTLAYAIEWAVKQGADVINLSLGAESDSRVLREAIQQAISQGVVVVAAAGNLNTTEPQFPASYPDVIAVTAVDSANHKAEFANYGLRWVDLAAPGVGITSTMVGPQGSGYASWSGTSMSTPFVSGALARLRQTQPNVSVLQLAAQFYEHSVSLDNLNPLYLGQLGGLLNVGETLAAAPTPSITPTPTSAPQPTATPTPTSVGPNTNAFHLFLPLTSR